MNPHNIPHNIPIKRMNLATVTTAISNAQLNGHGDTSVYLEHLRARKVYLLSLPAKTGARGCVDRFIRFLNSRLAPKASN